MIDMMQRIRSHVTLDTAELTIVSTFLLFLPILFIPSLTNSIELPKHLLLIITACLLWATGLLRILKTNTLSLHLSAPSAALLGLTIVSLLSFVFHLGPRMQLMLHPFGILSFISVLTISQTTLRLIAHPPYRTVLIHSLLISSIITGLCSVVWAASQLGLIPVSLTVHPSGHMRTALALQIIPVTLGLYHYLTQREHHRTQMFSLLTIILATGLLLATGVLYVAKFQTTSMPYALGWQVMLEIQKHLPVVGSGPLAYEYWYNQTKPITANLAPYWNLRFLTAPNLLLHLSSIYGLIGALLAAAWLLPLFLQPSRYRLLPLLGLAAVVVLFPPDVSILVLTGIGSMIVAPVLLRRRLTVAIPNLVVFPLTIAFCLLIIWISMVHLPWIRSEVLLARAIAQHNPETPQSTRAQVYQAYALTPYRDDLLRLSSQLSMAHAVQLLSQTDVTPDQQQAALSVVNQAIQEARQALDTNPLSTDNSYNLANTYLQLVPYVDGAADWAIQALEESYSTDPTNAFIRAQLGDLYTNQGNAIRAVQSLEAAVRLKPDYPLFHYALANLYLAIQNYQGALMALRQTLQLLPPDSADAQRVAADIVSIETRLSQGVDTNAPTATVSAELE